MIRLGSGGRFSVEKTSRLRKVICDQLYLQKFADVPSMPFYYKRAPKSAHYPYMVYTLRNISFVGDRDDYALDIDLWNDSEDQTIVDDVADLLEGRFANANLPEPNCIYPTFFKESRTDVEESDKAIQHVQLCFTVQMYTHASMRKDPWNN